MKKTDGRHLIDTEGCKVIVCSIQEAEEEKPFEGGRLVSTTEMIMSRGKTQIFACGTELFSKFKDDVCHPAVD